MANKKEANSTCVICGQKYHLCIACDRKKANWKPWRMFVDKENCYEIYKVLNDYNFKKITKDEARKLLINLDLSDVDTFKENIKEKINDIMKVEKIVKSYKRKKEKKIDEMFEQQKEIVEEITDEKFEIKNEVEEEQLEELCEE